MCERKRGEAREQNDQIRFVFVPRRSSPPSLVKVDDDDDEQLVLSAPHRGVFSPLKNMSQSESIELRVPNGHGEPSLPSPAVTPPPRPPRQKLSATTIIPIWIFFSSSVIMYNNYVYNTLNFKYPVFLVTWHLTFSVGARPLPLSGVVAG
jgi:hypothetical protein